jgi:hypothetical protein
MSRALAALGINILIFFVAIAFVSKHQSRSVCEEYHTVTKISELRYRDAVIELDNSTTLVVSQASLKIGDGVCTRYRK